MAPNEEDPPHPARPLRPAARRASSFSSSPSSSWESSPFSPFSPVNTPPLKFRGIPFSWEKIPGIPKHNFATKKTSSDHLLPLPPAGATTSSRKVLEEISPKKKFHRDPFFAALVECSKDSSSNNNNDDDDNNNDHKITRTLSDRFGLINMYGSCKRTCAVSESIVYLPRQQSSHYLLNRRSS